ncbi:MAG: hypothetical protein IV092_24940 [Burkholderiaceae bacterium]|nr:hypothetical protein [Burkholderiaceae bacterium]
MNAIKTTLLLFVLMNVLAIAACQPMADTSEPTVSDLGQNARPAARTANEADQ